MSGDRFNRRGSSPGRDFRVIKRGPNRIRSESGSRLGDGGNRRLVQGDKGSVIDNRSNNECRTIWRGIR